jgi:hypothetical protein
MPSSLGLMLLAYNKSCTYKAHSHGFVGERDGEREREES